MCNRFGLRFCFFFFQAEDGIRDLVRSRGLGDVYKRQLLSEVAQRLRHSVRKNDTAARLAGDEFAVVLPGTCLLYTSDAADDLPCVDLGGRRIIKKKK